VSLGRAARRRILGPRRACGAGRVAAGGLFAQALIAVLRVAGGSSGENDQVFPASGRLHDLIRRIQGKT
jgi:hypothetical protein